MTIKPFQGTLVLLFFAVILKLFRPRKTQFRPNKLTLLSMLAGFALWLNAPDFRFATWLFIIMGGLCFRELILFASEKSKKAVLIIAVVVGLAIVQDYLRLASVVIGKFPVVKENDLSDIGEARRVLSNNNVMHTVIIGALCGFTPTPCSNAVRPNLAEAHFGIWKAFVSKKN